MNNFLHNLTSRAVSVENEIRPRLPSLFEPTAALSPFEGASRFDEEHALIATGRDEDSAGRSPFLPHSVDIQKDARFNAEERVGWRPLLSAPRAPDARSNPSPSLPQLDFTETPREPAHRVVAQSRRPQSPIGDAEMSQPVPPEIATPALLPKSRRSASSENAVRDLEAQSDDAAGTRRVSTRSPVNLQLNDKRVDRDLVTNDEQDSLRSKAIPNPQPPRPDPALSERLPRRRQIASVSPVVEKVINVTIGRIEVRATSSPQTPAPRSENRSLPTTSLDDYLRQRGSSDRGGVA